MHANAAVRLSIEIRIEGTDIHASHCRVIRISGVVGSIAEEDNRALTYTLSCRVVSVCAVEHWTHLHTKAGVVISEVRDWTVGCSICLVINAFLAQRIAITIVGAWTLRNTEQAIWIAVKNGVNTAFFKAKMGQIVSK